nr:efflux RND transporter periplasmic adaptor subunit [Geobacteraceae bacterium]
LWFFRVRVFSRGCRRIEVFMKKIIIVACAVISVLAVAAYFLFGRDPAIEYKTFLVERGDIVATVSATGTLNAVTTVEVGTQVSGTIQKLFVDFNSRVEKGEPIAQIDPALFNAQVQQTRGAYWSALAAEEKARVSMADAQRTMRRNKSLLAEGIISQSDFDAAETAYALAQASLRAASASVGQTLGAYRQAKTNLEYSTIRSPVTGVVISRNVDVGQTVAASFQTPTLFTIAQDLTKMQIDTNVDEADISRVRCGQTARFTVDAFPELSFVGTVNQIRSAPVVTQNVVTYIVVIEVDNHDLKLKPGMTANVAIETAKKAGILIVPSAALRFRPTGYDSTVMSNVAGGSGKHAGGNGQRVFVLSREGKPVPAAVKTGIADSSRVELVSGTLKENDPVIVEEMHPKKANASANRRFRPRF